MANTSARTLELLALLQTGRAWRADELAERLGIAPRTVRRDIARLRSLGYDVSSSPCPAGAYRLEASVKVPPLLLDADEVSTLVSALLMLEAGVTEDASVTVVRAKLERLLPTSLRQRAAATALATQVLTATSGHVDWALVGLVADAVADGTLIRFTYTDQRARVSQRLVQPYRTVQRQGVWYLVGYDADRADWRVFRLDRVHEAARAGRPMGWSMPSFPDESIESWFRADLGRAHDQPRD